LRGGPAPLAAAFGLHAPPQGIHQIDNVRGSSEPLRLDALALLLLANELLERILVVILELFWMKMARFHFYDVFSQR
jgi:hypothetical protein